MDQNLVVLNPYFASIATAIETSGINKIREDFE